ncbi:MAG: hypothetical protein LBG22_12780 [Treponema sp.]|jgi:hypothetical protein|nr:hypothetical protein [Treponema sp.]
MKKFLFSVLLSLPYMFLFAQIPDPRPGETASADLYVQWAERTIAAGRWSEALQGLEKGADYRDVSSDLSYLLALARNHEGLPRGAALEALGWAREAGRWMRYTPSDCVLLEAELLIGVRNYAGALKLLGENMQDNDTMVLTLLALKGIPDMHSFYDLLSQTLSRYPRDPRPVHILFDYLHEGYTGPRSPAANELDLVALALRRLPYLLEADPELAWLSAPFIRDSTEARRLVEAYRAKGNPSPESIPAALNLGIIDDFTALDELFAARNGKRSVSYALLDAVWRLLRSPEGREYYRRNLLKFSGIITLDKDRDGRPESQARYLNGMLQSFAQDVDQDGLNELEASFEAGDFPASASVAEPAPGTGVFALPRSGEERRKFAVYWEKYPAVLRTEFNAGIYIPGPGEFLYRPFRFVDLPGGPSGLLYPLPEEDYSPLTRRTLVSFAIEIRRPSVEFPGAEERIELAGSVALNSAEYLEGRKVSETQYFRGRPVQERLDLDLDGRMETLRRFKQEIAGEEGLRDDRFPWDVPAIIEYTESDWDGDGIYESAEEYLPGGTVVPSWDMDGDGRRER